MLDGTARGCWSWAVDRQRVDRQLRRNHGTKCKVSLQMSVRRDIVAHEWSRWAAWGAAMRGTVTGCHSQHALRNRRPLCELQHNLQHVTEACTKQHIAAVNERRIVARSSRILHPFGPSVKIDTGDLRQVSRASAARPRAPRIGEGTS